MIRFLIVIGVFLCKQCLLNLFTFKRRLQDRSGFQGKEQLLSVLAKGTALFQGHNKLADESSSVTNVIVLVILRQVEDVLSKQFSLQVAQETKDMMMKWVILFPT